MTWVNGSLLLATVVVIDVGVTRLLTSVGTWTSTMVVTVKGVGQDAGAVYTNGSHVHSYGVLDHECSRSLDVIFRDCACRKVNVHDCELLIAVYIGGDRDG